MRYGGDVEEMPCQDGQQTHAHARGCGGLTCLAGSCDTAERRTAAQAVEMETVMVLPLSSYHISGMRRSRMRMHAK